MQIWEIYNGRKHNVPANKSCSIESFQMEKELQA